MWRRSLRGHALSMTLDAGEIIVKRVACVTAVLINAQNQILLYQRDNNPNIAFPGCWSTLGGLVETGETPAAARRGFSRDEDLARAG